MPDAVYHGCLKGDNCASSLHCWILINNDNSRSKSFTSFQQAPQDPFIVISSLARNQGAPHHTAFPVSIDNHEDIQWHFEPVRLCRRVIEDHISITEIELSLDRVHPEESPKTTRELVNILADEPAAILLLMAMEQGKQLNHLGDVRQLSRMLCFEDDI